ncbi:hypothetical protein GYM54_03060 [Pseudomonas sp. MTM4]|uniref:hypothetical protein n=1 Tax=unclassified Pseudomonas TaxID=196821 RepID=UPI0018D213B6|nr:MULTISPECIES: hypothetical protein [unclassified Pseudomonas]MBC8649294.1 hypothetical protein [Pseudomonas sp. MT4]QXY90647.1 hypothetical protein GYM54_03060 [Pseudomonas sp. MTM4]
MDVLTFTSVTIKSLAWPAVAIFLVLMLKKPITELIPLLRKLKYKELEIEFSEAVAELKAEAGTSILDVGNPTTSQAQPQNRLLQLVNFSTRAAIMEAWLEVETAATAVASSFWNQPPSDTFRNYPKLGDYLLQCKVIDTKQLETFNKLKQLRNKAAHAEELNLSESDAISYVELASALAAHIRAA